jgi:hypothetical protein
MKHKDSFVLQDSTVVQRLVIFTLKHDTFLANRRVTPNR